MSLGKAQYEAERWWLPAKEDLEVARALHESGKFSHACFLSQQSSEKSMIALWLSIDGDPWGHSIQKLVMQFPQPEMLSDVQKWVEYAAYLDRFYIPTRYPNGLPDLTPGQVYIMPPVTHLPWRAVPGQVCDREGYTAKDSTQAIEKSTFFLEQTRNLMKS